MYTKNVGIKFTHGMKFNAVSGSIEGSHITESQQIDLMENLSTWRITELGMLKILGLPLSGLILLEDMRKGCATTIPIGVRQRIEVLLEIINALYSLFPEHPELRSRWINQPHLDFCDNTPMGLFISDGFLGLLRVHARINFIVHR